MGITMNKSKVRIFLAIAAIFVITASSMLVIVPLVSAHSPAWNIPTYSFLATSASTIGVGQTIYLYWWLNWPPPTAGGPGGDRWSNVTITVTSPDGTNQTLGPFMSDDVGGSYASYVPQQTGVYSFQMSFPGQVLTNFNPATGAPGPYTPVSPYVGDYFEPSISDVQTVTVQTAQITPYQPIPLPTGYWQRPIYGQNDAWASIASNWLGGSTIAYAFQPYGIAPNSPHILWTRQMMFGGIVGGSSPMPADLDWYGGLSYEVKFQTPILINGYLYYVAPLSENPSGQGGLEEPIGMGGGTYCVNLQTGQTVWWQNITVNFAQIYDYESPNQHGPIANGYLWSAPFGSSTWKAYDPLTGDWLFTLTNVPSGTTVTGSDGSIDIYTLNATANYVTIWNNTASYQETLGSTPNVVGIARGIENGGTNLWQWRPIGKVIDTGADSNGTCYTGNFTIPSLPGTPRIWQVLPGDMIIGTSTPSLQQIGTTENSFGTSDPWIIWAISLKPGTQGKLLWMQSYHAPKGNVTTLLGYVDPNTRVFTTFIRETRQMYGYNLDTGNQIWGPSPSENDWNYYDYVTALISPITTIAYGNIYTAGYGGILYCYNDSTGQLEWTYGNGGAGNTTTSNFATPYGHYPIMIGAVADGIIYLVTTEHSPNSPLYQGAKVRAINAYTGQEIWKMDSWVQQGTMAVADGILVYFNYYDGQIYALGKGQTRTLVSTQDTVAAAGNSVLIQGTVTDLSPGVTNSTAKSPDGLGSPAISDANMAAWMQYTYMQEPKPLNATGVPVTLSAVDQSGNSYQIGTVTSDEAGLFSTVWTPPGTGTYTITATFAGTNSYFSSYSEAPLAVSLSSSSSPSVSNLSPTPSPAPAPGQGQLSEIYILAIAVAVIIVVAAVALIVAKRRPK